MFDQLDIIKQINRTCNIYFDDSTFFLQPNKANRFRSFGSKTSNALNRYKNESSTVPVVKWLKDFWIYIDIRFELSEGDIPNIFISISVFRGEESDDTKFQLFRAEWDNFEDNDLHPQPHWHIYSDHQLEKTFDDVIALLKDEKSFAEFVSEERAKPIELKKMHFAMNANWSQKGSHVHKIDTGDIMVNWFQGVLSHIQNQLKYISE